VPEIAMGEVNSSALEVKSQGSANNYSEKTQENLVEV